MKRWGKKHTWIAVAILVAGVFAAMIFSRQPMSGLTAESLEIARQKWRTSGIRSYELRYEMYEAEYFVRVREGVVLDLLRDGRETQTHQEAYYTVEGILDVLELELESRDDPKSPFGSSPETTFLRVRFHPEHGYVEQYLRAIGGTGRSQTIKLVEFKRLDD